MSAEGICQHFNPRTPCGVRPSCLTFVLPSTPYFNPRTPCGVRRANGTVNRSRAYFNPRTPCGVRHNAWTALATALGFQSTHPLRGATLLPIEWQTFRTRFQSTHPLRGATSANPCEKEQIPGISIHAPLAGCDVPAGCCATVAVISIHAPLAGCDRNDQTGDHRRAISIHAPLAGCDTMCTGVIWSCGISIHAPLAGCDRRIGFCAGQGNYFNPRTPCGVRLPQQRASSSARHFNPRTPCGVRQQKRTKKTALFLN